MRNPPSTQAYGSYSISIMSGTQKSLACTSVFNTVSTPATFSGGLTFNSKLISNSSTIARFTFAIPTTLPIPAFTYAILTYTTGPTLVYTGTMTSNPSSGTFIFSNIVNTVTSGTFSIGNFTYTNPPSTMSYTLTIKFYVNSSGNTYDIGIWSNIYNCNPGVMTGALTPGSLSINAISTYSLSLTTVNNLVSGSFINLIVPSNLVISSTCNVIGASCAYSSNNITVTFSSARPAGTFNINFQIKNPGSVQTTTTFTAFSYYSGYTSLVDNLTSGITVTFTANPITSASINPQQNQTSQSTSYQFSITNKDPIPIGGYFTLTFPTSVGCGSPTLVLTPISSSLDPTCTAQCVSSVVTFSNCMQSTVKTNTTPIAFSLSPIINPPSFAPSGYFQFYSYDSLSNMINYLNSSLSTFQVTMNTISSLSSTITAPSLTVNQAVTYSFQIVFSVPHVTFDYLTLTFPASMTPPSAPNCAVSSGLSSVSCSLVNGKIKVIMTFAFGFPNNKTVVFTIPNVNNNQRA